MAFPNSVPTGYSNDASAYRNAKVDRSGSLRVEQNTIAVADNASVGTRWGLVPFQKGARLNYGTTVIHVTDITTGTTTTMNVGYLYDSSTASDVDAFTAASTKPVTGGFLPITATAGLTFEAADDGWIIAELAGAAVTTAGTISFQIGLVYD